MLHCDSPEDILDPILEPRPPCAQVVTHSFHVNALAVSGAWRGHDFKALEVGVVGFWVLQFMWLKFTAIWRFFRLWALLTGISPPENMLRCVNNNYDIEGFWKVCCCNPRKATVVSGWNIL